MPLDTDKAIAYTDEEDIRFILEVAAHLTLKPEAEKLE
jgi:hypothetical protein